MSFLDSLVNLPAQALAIITGLVETVLALLPAGIAEILIGLFGLTFGG